MRSLVRDDPLPAAIAALAIVVLLFAVPSGRGGGADGALLVAADLRGRALLVVDPAAPDSIRTIPLPGGPHELLLLPDGRVLTSLEQAGALAAVDIESGAVETLELGGLPHGLALAGDWLYVTDRSTGRLRRFEFAGGPLASWREAESVPAGRWPHAVAALEGGRVATVDAAGSVLLLDGHVHAAPTMPETIAVSPGDTRIAVAGAGDGRVEVRTAQGEYLFAVETGGRPVRAVYAPDGALLAVALSAAGAVALVDEAGGIVTVSVGGVPDGLAFTPDGRRLFVSDLAGGRASVVDTRRGRVVASVELGRATGALALVPRG